MEAWAFITAGGALYNNLDYSFVAGHEDGTFVYPASQPGGGNPKFRQQLRALRDFIYSFNFIQMQPIEGSDLFKAGVPKGARSYALAKEGDSYAAYITPVQESKTENGKKRDGFNTDKRRLDLELGLPSGSYAVEFLDPVTGRKHPRQSVEATDGRLKIRSPEYSEDLAIAIRKE
jgi:hypothetical protein